ncbi:Uncharacterised protein [Yersinia pekkanenii]|uniref:Uncharacterized protein n=1 Tax=Yersinia pekkanenii TaxID=1288385 RepID=A0A0T9RMY5_9GAMM|nr:Uncharacterised protein [Yersinia pekkanenii]
MIRFLKQWVKSQSQYFFRTYVPIILTFIFAMFMAHYFPDSGLLAIGIFYIVMLILIFFIWR